PFKGDASHGIWHPYKKKIVFQGRIKGSEKYNIFTYDLISNKTLRLTREESNINPIWSHDGEKIYFCSDRQMKNKPSGWVSYYCLFVMDSNGLNQKVLFEDPSFDTFLPSIRSDGKFIAFSRRQESRYELWIMNVQNPNVRFNLTGKGFCRLGWNPANLNEVVFVKDRKDLMGDGMLYTDVIVGHLIIDESGLKDFKTVLNLTKERFHDYPNCPSDTCPSWSPDGRKIILSSTNDMVRSLDSPNWNLYIINSDGTGGKEIGGDRFSRAYFPSW
ncbi:unnamed protein product, partial [marine sediment metagenome]